MILGALGVSPGWLASRQYAVMQSVKMESRTRRLPSKCFPLADLDVDLTLVNAGPVVLLAAIFTFQVLFSVSFDQILLSFLISAQG